jgi:hypothetical protein
VTSRASRSTIALAALAILALGVGSGLIGWWAASRPPDLPVAPAPAGGYPALLQQAAGNLRAQVALDGAGLAFEVTQRQFLQHAEGAPPILVEPAPSASPVEVERVFQAGYLTHGFMHGPDFFAETRGGLPETGPGEFAAGELAYKVLIDDGVVWRDHGKGWFEVPAAAIPGNGIDPFSLSRLPDLLTGLVEVKEAGVDQIDGRPAHHFVGLGESADWPGIIVPDGLLFTASPVGIEAWVSDDGHLVQLRGQTSNLNEAVQTSVIVSEVHIGGDVPAMPAPSPLLVRPTPEPDGPTPAPSASAAP